MWRSLLILAWACCVLVTLALGAMWIRSYFARDTFSWWSAADGPERSEWTDRSITFGRGQVRVDYRSRLDTGPWTFPSGVTPGFKHEATVPFPVFAHIDGPPPDFEGWGFVFDYDHSVEKRGGGQHRWHSVLIVMPIWTAMLVFAIPASLPITARRSK